VLIEQVLGVGVGAPPLCLVADAAVHQSAGADAAVVLVETGRGVDL
jgi:hypothetical protein